MNCIRFVSQHQLQQLVNYPFNNHYLASTIHKLSKEEAFNELIAYLDSLASRKAGGDKTAQIEIEAVSALLSSK